MAQKKAHEVEAWVTRPDPKVTVILLYGPDHGLVTEHAAALAQKAGVALDDPFSVVRMDAAEADQEGRLLEEARTIPMFASRRLLWLRNVTSHKAIADDVKLLCADPPPETIVLIEAGDLKKGSQLRSAVESSAAAIALPCYGDEARNLDNLIDEVLGEHAIRIGGEARAVLRRNLGGDRLASRGELQKLALFAGDRGEVLPEDVVALTGDVSDLSLDNAVDAVLEGRTAALDLTFQRYVQAGGQSFLLVNALSRQLQLLQVLRHQLDHGDRSASEIIAAARPPIFFARRKAVESALRRFSASFLQRSLERLQSTVLQTRLRPDLSAALARQALFAITIGAGRLNSG